MAMATHPTGETVDIVGINCGDSLLKDDKTKDKENDGVVDIE